MREVGTELGDGGSLCRSGADGPETGVEGVRVWRHRMCPAVVPSVVCAGGCLSSRGHLGGSDLTLAGDVGAGATITLLPQATVAPRVADPVVGGSGENREDFGQEAQQGAPALEAPLHAHACAAAAEGHTRKIGRYSSRPQTPLPGPSSS